MAWGKDWLRHGTGNHRHPQHQTPRPRRLGIITYCLHVRLTPRSRSRVPPAKRKWHLALLVCQPRSNDLNVLQRPRRKRCGSPVPFFPPPFLPLSPPPFPNPHFSSTQNLNFLPISKKQAKLTQNPDRNTSREFRHLRRVQ